MTGEPTPDVDLRRTESKFSARSFWGSSALQCSERCCLGLWHRDDYHKHQTVELTHQMENDWGEPTGPLVMERGDMVKPAAVELNSPYGCTVGIVIGVDLGSNGLPSMATIAMMGQHNPRYDGPKPSGDTWCFVQRVQVSRYEILKKRVR